MPVPGRCLCLCDAFGHLGRRLTALLCSSSARVQVVPKTSNPIVRMAGPAFAANAARNAVMSSTSFVLTPITYKLFFPQEKKSQSTLFWYGLAMNIFVGNVIAINLQALWGRSLDALAADVTNPSRAIVYRNVITDGLKKEGMAAFFTPPKWFSRVLMNAPAQGTVSWLSSLTRARSRSPCSRMHVPNRPC